MSKLLYGIITAGFCGTDLWCKSRVEKELSKGEEREICQNKVVLRRVHNKGMVLNFGEQHPEIVRVLSGIVCGMIGVFSIHEWFRGQCVWRKLGAAFTLAGAVSNTYDRFARKYVVDYFGFKTKWKKFSQITFNLGDMFIFLGSILLLITELFGKRK